MKKILIATICGVCLGAEGDAPLKVTQENMLRIVTAERDLAQLQAEKWALISRLKDIETSLIPQATNNLSAARSAATPAGYELGQDYSLKKKEP